MTNKEYFVQQCEVGLRREESRMREAQSNLDQGYRKAVAQVEQAKADMEREYKRLKEELERAKTDCEYSVIVLARAKADAERGFDA